MAKLGLMALLNLDITRFENNMKKASKQTDMMGTAMKSLGGFVAGAFSIAAIGSFVKASFEAYQSQIEAETRLQSALGDREDIMKRLSDGAGELQSKTLYADDDIINAQSFFATLGLGEDAIRKLTPLVIDFASRFQMDIDTATRAVAKALSGNGKAFKELGYTIEGSAGSAQRFDSVMRQLADTVQGQAEEIANLNTSAFKRVGVAWDELMEKIGEGWSKMLDRANIPEFIEDVDKLLSKFGEGKAQIDPVTEAMQSYAQATEEGRKALRKQWEDVAAMSKEQIQMLSKTGQKSDPAYLFFSKQLINIREAIKAADEYDKAQTKATKVDQEAIDAANKLAEARLKSFQAQDREFINAVGYKDRTPKADFGKNITNDAVITQLDETLRVMRDIPNIQERITLSNDELIESLKVAEPSFQRFIVNLKTWKDKSEEVVKQMNEMLSIGIADMIGTISEGLANAAIEGSFRSFFLTIIDAIASFMQAFGKAIIAYAIAMEAFKKTFTNPWVAIGAGALLIATAAIIKGLVARQQQGLTEMAAGGIVTGPTPVLVGEYPGARSNPEVIAPLDKLSAMLGGSNTVNVRGRLSGADILISSERYDKLRTRLRGF